MPSYDLCNASFDEFVDYIFNHSLPASEDDEYWYWSDDLEVTYEPVKLVEHYTTLFSKPQILIDKYSDEQLEQGLLAMRSCLMPGAVSEVLWEEEVPPSLREECVRSMFFLYQDLFAVKPLHTACFMWWDSFTDEYSITQVHSETAEGPSIQNVMFEILCQTLKLDVEICQHGALHGLGHLRHPGTEAVIRTWMASKPDLDQQSSDFAEECIVGNIV